MLNNIKKQFICGLLILILSILLTQNTTALTNQINISSPPAGEVLIYDNSVNFEGNIDTKGKNIKEARISFDGNVWRLLPVNKDQEGYTFSYNWTVTGKNRTYVIIEATLDQSEEKIKFRTLYDIYKSPEIEEVRVMDIINEYRDEDSKNNQSNSQKSDDNYLVSTELMIESILGGFLENNWKALLPTISQQTLLMSGVLMAREFVIKYPAGLDILNILFWPYLIIISMLIFFILILENTNNIIEYILYMIFKLFAKSADCRSYGYVFDAYSLQPVHWVKMIIKNNEDHRKKYIVYSDDNGKYCLNGIPLGEYSVETLKNGYKYYNIESLNIEQYRGGQVLENSLKILNDNKIFVSIPIVPEVGQERWNIMEVNSIFYKIKKWFIKNINTLLSLGYLSSLSWLLYANNQWSYCFLILLTFGYLVDRSFYKTKNPWGVVIDMENNTIDHLELELFRDNKYYMSVWTDWQGKYSFGELENGEYEIRIGDKNWNIYDSTNRYYHGEKIIIENNLCLLRIDILVNK